jgi:hypothetical protein
MGVGEVKKMKSKGCNVSGGGGAVYGLGLIGALVYYLQSAATFSDGLIGVLKAIVWPGVVVYRLFGYLGL